MRPVKLILNDLAGPPTLTYAPEISSELLLNRAIVRINLEKYDLAKQDLQRAIKLNDEFHHAYYILAKLKKDLGEEDACEMIKIAIKKGQQIKGSEYKEFCL